MLNKLLREKNQKRRKKGKWKNNQ